MTSPDVEVTRAAPRERPILENLFQLYVHDFSELWSDQPRGELDAQGLFERYEWEPYWSDETHVPFLVRRAGRLAGFVLLNRESHFDRTVDWNVAELFVVRKHRSAGVGRSVMSILFDRHPGAWETVVARRNTRGIAFWRALLTTHPRVRELQECELSPPVWSGPAFRYRVSG